MQGYRWLAPGRRAYAAGVLGFGEAPAAISPGARPVRRRPLANTPIKPTYLQEDMVLAWKDE